MLVRSSLAFAASLLGGCHGVIGLLELDSIEPPDATTTADGPIAHWSFDNMEEPFVDDVAGHDGMCLIDECPTIVEGRAGLGVLFDGVDDIVKVPAHAAFETRDAFTVVFWLKPMPTTNLACPIDKPLDATANTWQYCYRNDSRFFTQDGGPSQQPLMAGAPPFDTWSQIVLRYENRQRTLVINGNVAGPQPGTSMFTFTQVTLGADIDNAATAVPYAGSLDEVRIYSRALSDDELTDLRNI